MNDYTFCEPVWAHPASFFHIRELGDHRGPKQPMYSGGPLDTPTLCKRLPWYGWDVEGVVDETSINARLNSELNPVCPRCVDEWRRQQPGYVEPPAPAPSMQGYRPTAIILDEMVDPF